MLLPGFMIELLLPSSYTTAGTDGATIALRMPFMLFSSNFTFTYNVPAGRVDYSMGNIRSGVAV